VITLKIQLSLCTFVVAACSAQTIGKHKSVYDARGTLLPWTSWQDALDREMKWYLNCPVEHGYPRFVYQLSWMAITNQ
jgi:hypothetical protein